MTSRMFLDDRVGRVVRGIGCDEDFEAVCRIVEGEGVLELVPDFGGLIPRRDDDRDVWKELGSADAACSQPRARPEYKRIAEVRVHDQARREPEQVPHAATASGAWNNQYRRSRSSKDRPLPQTPSCIPRRRSGWTLPTSPCVAGAATHAVR